MSLIQQLGEQIALDQFAEVSPRRRRFAQGSNTIPVAGNTAAITFSLGLPDNILPTDGVYWESLTGSLAITVGTIQLGGGSISLLNSTGNLLLPLGQWAATMLALNSSQGALTWQVDFFQRVLPFVDVAGWASQAGVLPTNPWQVQLQFVATSAVAPNVQVNATAYLAYRKILGITEG